MDIERYTAMAKATLRRLSAFSRLSPDNIFEIMMHNVNMDNDPPIAHTQFLPQFSMNVLRSASQVNRDWRKVALSASLWSRVLNMNLFKISDIAKDRWFKIVWNRIGRSNFDLKCEFTSQMYPSFALFVLNLIGDNWRQIRRLDIGTLDVARLRIDGDYLRATDHLVFLGRPVLALQSINVRLHPVPGTDNILGFCLFNGFVPFLREFHCSNVKLDMAASWLYNLHSLHIDDSQSGPLPINQLRSLLGRMQDCLQSLEIRQAVVPHPVGATVPGQSTERQEVRLKRLRNLVINNRTDLNACWEIAALINPVGGCCLNFKPLTLPAGVVPNLKPNILHRYLNKHLTDSDNRRRPSFLRITASPIVLRIADHVSPEWTRKWHGTNVFDVEIHFLPHMSHLSTDLFKMLYECDYSSIVHLELGVSPDLFRSNAHLQAQAPESQPSFAQFIQSFSSVQILTTTVYTLEVIHNFKHAHNNSNLIFPNLKTLQMYELTHDHIANYLAHFLLGQWNAGCPVQVFDFTLDHSGGISRNNFWDLRYLEIFTGMVVKWRLGGQHEYVCGSGTPEELLIVC